MAGITYEIEDKGILEQIRSDAARAAEELVEAAHLGKGQIVVIGCSTSETLGQKLGSHSVPEAGKVIFEFLPARLDNLDLSHAARKRLLERGLLAMGFFEIALA